MREFTFEFWEWEEGSEVLTVEDVGLCKTHVYKTVHPINLHSFSALIITAVGLVTSTVVFIVEKIIYKFKNTP